MNRKNVYLISAIAIAALQACSSVPVENPMLTGVQQEFRAAQASPEVTTLASAELREAQLALDKAQSAWANQETLSQVEHLSYLAGRKLAIATETTNQRLAEKAINEAQAKRTQTLLVARTLEADASQRNAEAAQRGAEASKQQADASAAATTAARQDTAAALALAASLKAQLADLDAKQTERGMVVTIGDVLFDNNSAVLKSGANSSVQRLAAFLLAYPQRNALIEGYTDSVGSMESNQTLSERRANSVRAALVAGGVLPQRLGVAGYGEGYPLGDNQTVQGRVANRRVEIVLSDETGATTAR
jgi:outer membrane protein OmpA-like peptidoglycan-associated protein